MLEKLDKARKAGADLDMKATLKGLSSPIEGAISCTPCSGAI